MAQESLYHWQRLGLFGGNPVVDFVNTIEDEGKTRDHNALPDWPHVLEWAVLAQVLTPDESACVAAILADGGAEDTAQAETALDDLIRFREGVWRVFSDLAAERQPDVADAEALTRQIAWAQGLAHMQVCGRSVHWQVSVAEAGAAVVRARLALAAGALLTSPDLTRLKECGRCTALYLDHGRGKGRRWCRMSTCGNRAKVERFRAKQETASLSKEEKV